MTSYAPGPGEGVTGRWNTDLYGALNETPGVDNFIQGEYTQRSIGVLLDPISGAPAVREAIKQLRDRKYWGNEGAEVP
jgi:hypothetical protein